MTLVPPLALVLLLVLAGVHLVSRSAWAWRALWGLSLGLLVSGAALGLWWAPSDRYMGEVQRIMYVHVPLVWMALLGAALTFGASVASLWSGSRTADDLAQSAAEVGLVLGGLGVVMGSIWGRPTWGEWWSWDPRLTATVVMLLALGASLLIRKVMGETRGPLIAALVGCTQAVAVPVVVLSVRLWNTLHQLPSTPETMHQAMTLTLRWNGVGFLCLFFVFLRARMALFAPRRPAT